MKSIVYSLIKNFLLGGFIVASISYIGTFMDPLLGAIWWSFPLSILPTLFFMKKHGKSNNYISKFALSTTYALVLLVLSTGFLAYFIKKNTNNSLWSPIGKTVMVWLLSSIFFFGIIKYFKLENKFM